MIYFNCSSGISGDMILGALIDLGISADYLKKELLKLGLKNYRIIIRKAIISNVTATDVNVICKKEHHHRNLDDINRIINSSRLGDNVKKLSKKIFLRLARAEAKVHKTTIKNVHFHEVGALDSIIDIIGSAILLTKIGEKAYCSAINVGSGNVNAAHGIMNVPVPATKELLKGRPYYKSKIKKELTTPTGAAIITAVASFRKISEIRPKRIGCGAGKYKLKEQPNVLQAVIF